MVTQPETFECPDCDSEVDEYGNIIHDQPDHHWIHAEDCRTCGAVFCDSSC